jgi:raffinose/stachyose/melibiose transport system permease protein
MNFLFRTTERSPNEVPPSPRTIGSVLARRPREWQRNPSIWWIVPVLIPYLGFTLIPLVRSLVISLFISDGTTPPTYVGIANYQQIASDPLYLKSLSNTLKYAGFVLTGQSFIGFFVAWNLQKRGKFRGIARGIYFFPSLLSAVSVAIVFSFVYDGQFGLVNALLKALGFSWNPALLAAPKTALFLLAGAQIWFHGGQVMMLFLAGLSRIPVELLEAARLDGASGFSYFRHIVWPLLAQTVRVVCFFSFLVGLRAFDLVQILTQGGPDHSTDVLSTGIYRSLLNFQYGKAAAQSVVLLVFVALGVSALSGLLRIAGVDDRRMLN